MNGQNVLVFICTFVGINAAAEMLASTIITGAVGSVLIKARLIPAAPPKKTEKQEKDA